MGWYTVIKEYRHKINRHEGMVVYPVGRHIHIELRDQAEEGVKKGFLKKGKHFIRAAKDEGNAKANNAVVKKASEWTDEQQEIINELAKLAGLKESGMQLKMRKFMKEAEGSFDKAVYLFRKDQSFLTEKEMIEDYCEELNKDEMEEQAVIHEFRNKHGLKVDEALEYLRISSKYGYDADEIYREHYKMIENGEHTKKEAFEIIIARIEEESVSLDEDPEPEEEEEEAPPSEPEETEEGEPDSTDGITEDSDEGVLSVGDEIRFQWEDDELEGTITRILNNNQGLYVQFKDTGTIKKIRMEDIREVPVHG